MGNYSNCQWLKLDEFQLLVDTSDEGQTKTRLLFLVPLMCFGDIELCIIRDDKLMPTH